MKRRNTIILGLLLLIIVVEIIVLAPKEIGIFASDSPPQGSVSPQSRSNFSGSSQMMSDVHLVEAKGGGKEWELWASRAIRPKEDEQWEIEQVRVQFFADDGVIYTVTGESGHVVTEKNDIQIKGNVETKSSNGYVFKTDSVFYDSKARRLTSPSLVEMAGPADPDGSRLKLKGAEMIAEFASNEMSVNKNVSASKKIREGKSALIRSQRAVFSGRTNMARFFGDVQIDFDSVQISGPDASFSYDPKTQSFESVEVSGGVRMSDADKFATSGRVSVQIKQDRIVLSGGPRVFQDGDELAGDEIVFLEGGKKVQVSNAKAQIAPSKVPPPISEKAN